MNYADLVLIVLVGGFALFGLLSGLFKSVGALAGTIIAAVFTGRVVDYLTHTFGNVFGTGEMTKVITYIVVFLILSRLIGLAFWILGKLLGIVSWIPFVKTIDHLLGGVFGFVEGIVIVGFVLLYASHVLPPVLLNQAHLEQSQFAKYVLDTMKALELFLPDNIRNFILTTAATATKVIPKLP